MVEQHFVTFYSPGTLFSEETSKKIKSWDVDEAIKMVHGIKERHGATPYGFRFSTRGRGHDDLDSRQTAESNMYFLGGKTLSLQDIIDRNDPKDKTLIANMEGNGYDYVVENTNSWKTTLPLNDGDKVSDWEPKS
jgi:hypothetical protein